MLAQKKTGCKEVLSVYSLAAVHIGIETEHIRVILPLGRKEPGHQRRKHDEDETNDYRPAVVVVCSRLAKSLSISNKRACKAWNVFRMSRFNNGRNWRGGPHRSGAFGRIGTADTAKDD